MGGPLIKEKQSSLGCQRFAPNDLCIKQMSHFFLYSMMVVRRRAVPFCNGSIVVLSFRKLQISPGCHSTSKSFARLYICFVRVFEQEQQSSLNVMTVCYK